MSTRTCPDCRTDLPDRVPPVAFCPNCGAGLADVRPTQRDPGSDAGPLAGWDRDESPRGRSTDPVSDGTMVAVGAVIGLAAGTVVAPGGRRGRVGVVGLLLGVGLAAARRRIWELDPPDRQWVDRLQR